MTGDIQSSIDALRILQGEAVRVQDNVKLSVSSIYDAIQALSSINDPNAAVAIEHAKVAIDSLRGADHGSLSDYTRVANQLITH